MILIAHMRAHTNTYKDTQTRLSVGYGVGADCWGLSVYFQERVSRIVRSNPHFVLLKNQARPLSIALLGITGWDLRPTRHAFTHEHLALSAALDTGNLTQMAWPHFQVFWGLPWSENSLQAITKHLISQGGSCFQSLVPRRSTITVMALHQSQAQWQVAVPLARQSGISLKTEPMRQSLPMQAVVNPQALQLLLASMLARYYVEIHAYWHSLHQTYY